MADVGIDDWVPAEEVTGAGVALSDAVGRLLERGDAMMGDGVGVAGEPGVAAEELDADEDTNGAAVDVTA